MIRAGGFYSLKAHEDPSKKREYISLVKGRWVFGFNSFSSDFSVSNPEDSL
jgi:hypothetical protein